MINAYVSAARDRIERYCNQYFTASNFELVYTGLEGTETVCLPFPVESVVTAGLSFDPYLNAVTPTTDWGTGTVVIEVITEDTAPPSIYEAILLYIADYYDNRMAQADIQLYENEAAMFMIQPYRIDIGI